MVNDLRDNRITTPTNVSIDTIGSIMIDNKDGIDATVGANGYTFTVDTEMPGGEARLYATLPGVTNAYPDSEHIIVQYDMIPKTGLNIMYLNLFGNDW